MTEASLHALLIENEVGATYEGYVWNRFLKVEVAEGITLEVFDRSAITSSLLVGNEYDFLIGISVLKSLRILAPGEQGDMWAAQIIDLNWDSSIQSDSYLKYSPDLNNRWFVRAATRLGNVLLDRREAEQWLGTLHIGMNVIWQKPRLDLYAVLRQS